MIINKTEKFKLRKSKKYKNLVSVGLGVMTAVAIGVVSDNEAHASNAETSINSATSNNLVQVQPTKEQAQNNLDIIANKWESKYPKLMSNWYSEWDAITPIFKFSVKVRTVIYTTNAVKSVNSRLRSMYKKQSVFPNKVSLEKALYLAVERIVKKWPGAIRDWGQIYGELRIMYENRI